MGDFNGSGNVTVGDIDILNANMGGNPGIFDLTGDGLVNANDRRMIIEGILASRLGDANLDRRVDSLDRDIFNANQGPSGLGWAGADFDGNGVVDNTDRAFIDGNFGFENTPIPEPASVAWLAVVACGILQRRRDRGSLS